MNRRDFLKYMSVTPAAAAATKILANVPEVEPKIQLLEEKKIITDISEDCYVFTNVIQYNIAVNNDVNYNNLMAFHNWKEVTIDATCFLIDSNGHPIHGLSDPRITCENISHFKIALPELNNRKFITTRLNTNVSHSEFITVDISGKQVSEDGHSLRFDLPNKLQGRV